MEKAVSDMESQTGRLTEINNRMYEESSTSAAYILMAK